jgi:hypothetical protein
LTHLFTKQTHSTSFLGGKQAPKRRKLKQPQKYWQKVRFSINIDKWPSMGLWQAIRARSPKDPP